MTAAESGPDADRIRTMFGSIAGRYDRANTVLSAGVHHRWRKRLVRWSGVGPGQSVVDCATGTGDLAIEFKKAVGDGIVIGTDFCEEMLDLARHKVRRRGMDVAFESADATNLPYDSDRFDASSIAFGIRNVSDPGRGLYEMSRVVRPGGVVMVLEFGQVSLPVFKQLYGFYSTRILPKLGGIVTGQHDAYAYLEKSSSNFPCRDAFLRIMEGTGSLTGLRYKSLMGGIAYMYRGTVT